MVGLWNHIKTSYAWWSSSIVGGWIILGRKWGQGGCWPYITAPISAGCGVGNGVNMLGD